MVTPLTESTLITLEGSAITLTFTVTESLPPVQLMSSNWTVINTLGLYIGAPDDLRFRFTNNFLSLIIDPVYEEDEGIYVLTARNDAGLLDVGFIVVDVQCECFLFFI